MGAGAFVDASKILSLEASTTGTLPFPKDGVRLSFATEFINSCGGRDQLSGLTTNDVCERFVKPPTLAFKSSYCEFLRAQSHPAVDTATVFISHAWKYMFLDVVDAILDHFKYKEDVVIWFDLFANNQHKAVDLNFDWWCNTFKSAIKQFGHTVMVIAPWSNPVTLTRAWCLFEIFCTIDTKSKFDIALSDSERKKFIQDMESNGTDAIDNMLAVIDAEKSECYHQQDKARIFDVVRKTVGFDNINSLLFSEMREFVISATERRFDAETTNDVLKIKYGIILGKLYTAQGRFDSAEPLLVSSLQCAKADFGEDHTITLDAETNLAVLYQIQDKFELAEELFISSLAKKTKLFGEDSATTLMAMNNLACVYGDVNLCFKAERLFTRCLELRTAKFGERHIDTVSTMSNLSGLYIKMGQVEHAERFGSKSVEISTQLLGDDHPDTLVAMNNLAGIYEAKQSYDEAEKLYKFILKNRLESLGDDHPMYMNSLFNLGVHFHSRGMEVEGKEMLDKCAELRMAVFGPTHELTVQTLEYLKNVENDDYKMKILTEEVVEDV